ncbi:esterase 1 [Mycena rosella]|uniref:Esterase 1 n=1 Tax=Mycena rosella TaxID=1033263 RepID=A0AAD7GSS2_MYCRO|nr:esterase 1 [Mycena rosella]
MLFSLFIFISLSAATPQVELGNSTVIGRSISELYLEFFGGIPFAEPPIGPLRLNATVLKTLLPSVVDATNFGKLCMQPGLSRDLVSEDCLTLNIFRPAGLPLNASLPVLFWTYGGGFTSGGSSQFNASAIVAQSVARGTPIIYVSFNYRLGPLGFPQGFEASQRGILNLALRDQLACLEWVQLFIGAFGGDPSKVTMFGQSSGAIMTALLFMGSNNIERFARAAIFESGSAASAAVFEAARGESDWQNFVGGVPSCNVSRTLDCLQTVVDSDEILAGCSAAAAQAQDLFPWIPTLDGPAGLVRALPSAMLASGSFSRLPFIAGTNMDEGTIFTANYAFDGMIIDQIIVSNFSPPSTSPSDLQIAAQMIVQLYPNVTALGSPFNTGNETFGLSPQHKRAAAIEGDISFQSQRRLWAQTASAQGIPVFCYLFTEPQTPPSLGVRHGSEVPFVYGGVGPSDLSKTMIDYWVSFATSLDPNDGLGAPRPLWTAYTPDNQNLIQLNAANTTMIPDTYRNGRSCPHLCLDYSQQVRR